MITIERDALFTTGEAGHREEGNGAGVDVGHGHRHQTCISTGCNDDFRRHQKRRIVPA